MHWPKISIVTPSFNQVAFLERTLCSVLDQGYPNLEYIVIDGGSTDGSLATLEKYASRLTYWVSEPDRGQAHALNKGLLRATGDVIGWLNSDDLYCPGALRRVGEWFAAHPATEVFYGGLYFIDCNDRVTDAHWACPPDPGYTFCVGMDVHQQALFWRRELMERVGMIDETLCFSMDLDFVLRLLLEGRVGHTNVYLGMFREHAAAKTATIVEESYRENQIIFERYRSRFPHVSPWLRLSLQLRRLACLAKDAPLTYLAFKLARRAQLPAPVSWLSLKQ